MSMFRTVPGPTSNFNPGNADEFLEGTGVPLIGPRRYNSPLGPVTHHCPHPHVSFGSEPNRVGSAQGALPHAVMARSAVADYEEIFNQSYWRVHKNAIGDVPFVDAFLENLVRSSPEVADRMARGDTERFRSALTLGIVHLASFRATGQADSVLAGIAKRQSRTGRDIAPHLYEFFLQALLQTVEQYDPDFSPDVRKAWEVMLRPGLEYMKSMY